MNILWGNFVHLIIILRLTKEKRRIGSFQISALYVVVFKSTFPFLYRTGFYYPKDVHALFRISSYLNWQIQYWYLTMKSQWNIPFLCCLFFFFSFLLKKKKKKVIMPKCHRHWQIIHPIQKIQTLKFFSKDLSFLLRRMRVRVSESENKSSLVSMQRGISFPISNNPV